MGRHPGPNAAGSRRGRPPPVPLDLDGFGEVNRNIGHAIADEVLVEVGPRLRAGVRGSDTLGRIGGDELVIFYADATSMPAARLLAKRVEQAIRRPIATSTCVVEVGVSIGAVIVRPSADIPGRATLAHWADRAMQEQKAAQRAGQAQSRIRFHEYGLASPGAEEPATPGTPGADTNDVGGRDARRAATLAERLMLGAVLAAGTVFVLTLAAVIDPPPVEHLHGRQDLRNLGQPEDRLDQDRCAPGARSRTSGAVRPLRGGSSSVITAGTPSAAATPVSQATCDTTRSTSLRSALAGAR